MNLKAKLRNEIDNLNILQDNSLKAKLIITRYIYLRLGELFDFDARYYFANLQEKMAMLSNKLDKENITKNTLICTEWSHLYKSLLQDYGIDAHIINKYFSDGTRHNFVEIELEDYLIHADFSGINLDYVDMKFGLPTNDFYILKNEEKQRDLLQEIDELLNYKRDVNTLDILYAIKDKLQQQNLTEEEYVFKAIKAMETILNFPRPNVNFASGSEYLISLADLFLPRKYYFKFMNYYDLEKNTYIKIAFIIIDQETYYYCYQQINGYYKFYAVSLEKVKNIMHNYQTDNDYSLRKKIKK